MQIKFTKDDEYFINPLDKALKASLICHTAIEQLEDLEFDDPSTQESKDLAIEYLLEIWLNSQRVRHSYGLVAVK